MEFLKKFFQYKGQGGSNPWLWGCAAFLKKSFKETYPDESIFMETEFTTRSLAQGKYLLGGLEMEAFEPRRYMDKVTKVCEDTDKALKSNNSAKKKKILGMVEEMIRDSQRFIEMGNWTCVQAFRKDKKFFTRVDMSKRQELVSRILPLLSDLKERLSK